MARPAYQIVKRPILTEKGTRLRETGGRIPGSVTEDQVEPKVFFEVATDANKIEIRKAVEELGSCQVAAVNTIVMKGKRKRARRGAIVHAPNWKKAFVTLKEGESLRGVLATAFEGV